jgi:hypothetical protein
VTKKEILIKDLNLIVGKLSIDKENDVKMSFRSSKPYAEIARGCCVRKTKISRIRAQYDPNRPCNEPGRPKVLKNRDVV